MQLWEPEEEERAAWRLDIVDTCGLALCLVLVIFVVPNFGAIVQALELLLHGQVAR